MNYKLLAVAALAITIYSCASKANKTSAPTEEIVKVELTPEMAEGKMLYENNCAKCHKLFDPKKFSAEDWKPIVMKMQKKAHLDDMQGQKIYNYLIAG